MKDETNRNKASTTLSRAGQGGKGQGQHAQPQAGNFSFFVRHRSSVGFTLVELLTVIIIIAILMGILLPVVSAVRKRAQNTGVEAQIGALRQAIDQYYADFHSYPGPVSNQVMGTTAEKIYYDSAYNGGAVPVWMSPWTSTSNFLSSTGVGGGTAGITGTENLVLGLMGGLKLDTKNPAAPVVSYNPNYVARGPVSMDTGLPKQFGAYIDDSDLSADFKASDPSTHIQRCDGFYHDGVVGNSGEVIDDTPIPEILDRYPSKMPILYIRANPGATMSPTGNYGDDVNPVVIYATGGGSTYGTTTGQTTAGVPLVRYAQYDISQIIAYTQSYNGGASCIGEGKTPPTYVGWGSPPAMAKPQKATYPFHGLQSIGAGGASGSTAILNNNPQSGQVYQYPYPAFPYFMDPNSPAYAAGPPVTLPYARAKDTYILISAGSDRIYGTADDITSFGDVRP